MPLALGTHAGRSLNVAVDHRDPRALSGKPLCHRQTKPGPCSCHRNMRIFQLHFTFSFSAARIKMPDCANIPA